MRGLTSKEHKAIASIMAGMNFDLMEKMVFMQKDSGLTNWLSDQECDCYGQLVDAAQKALAYVITEDIYSVFQYPFIAQRNDEEITLIFVGNYDSAFLER